MNREYLDKLFSWFTGAPQLPTLFMLRQRRQEYYRSFGLRRR
jgi:hypothetical protein